VVKWAHSGTRYAACSPGSAVQRRPRADALARVGRRLEERVRMSMTSRASGRSSRRVLAVSAGCAAVLRWSGLCVSSAGAAAGGVVVEQAPAAPAQPAPQGRQGGRGGRGGGGGPQGGAPIAFDNHTGYRQIFDGASLAGWDGDPAFWRVENGVITGETTPDNPIKQNSFLIWRGGRTADFDLKLEFRINAGNTGVQYRSQQLPEGGTGDIGKWVLKGYQADIDFA